MIKKACDAFLYHEESSKLPEAAIFIIYHLPDPSGLCAECTSFHLISYVLNLKKTKDFNVSLIIPEDLMARFENKSKTDYQETIKNIPGFFESVFFELRCAVDVSFSDREKEVINKKLFEFAEPLIKQFQPSQ